MLVAMGEHCNSVQDPGRGSGRNPEESTEKTAAGYGTETHGERQEGTEGTPGDKLTE